MAANLTPEAMAEEVGALLAEQVRAMKQDLTVAVAEAKATFSELKSDLITLRGQVQGQAMEFYLSWKRDADRELERQTRAVNRIEAFTQPLPGERGEQGLSGPQGFKGDAGEPGQTGAATALKAPWVLKAFRASVGRKALEASQVRRERRARSGRSVLKAYRASAACRASAGILASRACRATSDRKG